MNIQATPSYGMEMEKVFSTFEGEPWAVGDDYFLDIVAANQARGFEAKPKYTGETMVGASVEGGEESLDNSFLLGESSTVPVHNEDGGLNALNDLITQQLGDVQHALARNGATVINMANHPLLKIDQPTYDAHVAPKLVYNYLKNVRGWNHMAGINAKAQNSPSVGVHPETAIGALNATLGIGGALIALYGNSPFEQGMVARHKESRLSVWEDMFGMATFARDQRMHVMPEQPFDDFKEYFEWMFPKDSGMFFVVTSMDGSPPKSEKGDVALAVVEEHPNLLEYLQKDQWSARDFETGTEMTVIPSMEHLAHHQFTHFAGARIRYGFNGDEFDVDQFNQAMARGGKAVDDLMSQHLDYAYIEGRDPGATFADAQLIDTAGEEVAESALISAAAIHAGLIRNADAAQQLIDRYGWDTLRGLREDAITNGMQARYNGVEVSTLCEDVLEIAATGLSTDEQWMLRYPEHVLSTNQNGAERALKRYDELSGSAIERIRQIACERAVILG